MKNLNFITKENNPKGAVTWDNKEEKLEIIFEDVKFILDEKSNSYIPSNLYFKTDDNKIAKVIDLFNSNYMLIDDENNITDVDGSCFKDVYKAWEYYTADKELGFCPPLNEDKLNEYLIEELNGLRNKFYIDPSDTTGVSAEEAKNLADKNDCYFENTSIQLFYIR